MKIFNSIIAVLLLSLGSISAQTFIGKLNPFPQVDSRNAANTTYNVLAVMVEFQEDNDGATFGNGKFGSIYTGENATSKDIIDPLPHDKNYFNGHLQFADNYFRKVSNGNVSIRATVFDSIITVSKTMRNYSPLPKSDDLTNVVSFAEEVWQIVEANYSGDINFGDYDLYAIFHAGVGRDVSLPGSIGNERDLPSVYLSKSAFKNYLGDEFEGFTGNGVNGVIDNTMIIPCTESREIDAVSGVFLLELSINGLIVASIGSHLGLPDLYNTETGLSSIGRFGLMDGQSIFTYGGLFPPEPSPWEKMYLGWITPEVVQLGENFVSLSANLAATASDTVYLKVPINKDEYYLVENRSRDVFNDGVKLTILTNNGLEQLEFIEDTTGFRSYEIDSVKGVVVDVDEYDWAVPGNGIIIWHIDESVINEKLASNTINNDKERKGVDVEEADGIQDIGERFFTVFGDEVIGEGSEEDLWYSSNEAKLYENRFSYDTKPNTNSNGGANSLITIENFSDIANKMSFKVLNGSNGISLKAVVSLYSQNIGIPASFLNYNHTTLGSGLIAYGNGDITDIGLNGVIKLSIKNFSKVRPAAIVNDTKYGALGMNDNQFRFYVNGTLLNIPSGIIPSAPPVIEKLDLYRVFVGSVDGSVYSYTLDFGHSNTPVLSGSQKFFDTPVDMVVTRNVDGVLNYGAVSGSKFKFGDYPEFDAGDTIRQAATSVSPNSGDLAVLMTDTKIFLLQNGNFVREIDLGNVSYAAGFALANIQTVQPNDLAIFVAKGEDIYAWNYTGAVVDNFPIKVAGADFGFVPSVTTNQANSNTNIYVVTTNGKLYSFDAVSGEINVGYPIVAGNTAELAPYTFNDNSSTAYVGVLSESGTLSLYSENYQSASTGWNGYYGNNANTGFLTGVTSVSKRFSFDESRAYNWPNPVYEDVTYIRYYVGEDSNVEIKIFDIAGDYVAELTDSAIGGFDNETTWNVSEIQSGVYFANLKVTGKSGNSASKIIKIAVIK